MRWGCGHPPPGQDPREAAGGHWPSRMVVRKDGGAEGSRLVKPGQAGRRPATHRGYPTSCFFRKWSPLMFKRLLVLVPLVLVLATPTAVAQDTPTITTARDPDLGT